MSNELEPDDAKRADDISRDQRTDAPRSRPASAWRPVLLVVVVLGGVVIGTVALLRRPTPTGGAGGMRTVAPPPRTLSTLVAMPLRHGVHGALVFRWQPVDGADTYALRLFSGEFLEIARFETSADSLVLSREDVAKLQLPSKTLLWRVVAAHGDEDLATSRVATEHLP